MRAIAFGFQRLCRLAPAEPCYRQSSPKLTPVIVLYALLFGMHTRSFRIDIAPSCAVCSYQILVLRIEFTADIFESLEPQTARVMVEFEHNRLGDPKAIYTLGRISFIVKSADAAFERELARLLPRPRVTPDTIHEVQTGSDLRELISDVLGRHTGCLWIDAACLLSPHGKKVLISGHSGAGKSTTALALALRYGWKVLAEDVTLIDPQTNTVIVFASPFSLKAGTLEQLRESISMSPDPVVFGEWVSMNGMSAEDECSADFDLSFYFGEAGNPGAVEQFACTPAEYTRLLLSCSNLVHDSGRPDRFVEYVGSGKCYKIVGGSLPERLNLILELAKCQLG